MIAIRGRDRLLGNASFSDAVAYIVRHGESRDGHEPPLAVWSDGVMSIETAALEMEAVAKTSNARKPLYHLIVSMAPGEQPNFDEARAILDVQLKHLGFGGLQYVAALQNDGKGGLWHIHAVINRVDPERRIARPLFQDFEKLRAASREAELRGGWQSAEVQLEDRPRLKSDARQAEYVTRRRSFQRVIREEIGPEIQALLSGARATWQRVHATLGRWRVRYEEVVVNSRLRGGRLIGNDVGEYAAARDLGPNCRHRDLVAQLGPFQSDEQRVHHATFEERCVQAAADIRVLRQHSGASWADVHAVFRLHNLVYAGYRLGARISDVSGPQTIRATRVDRELSLPKMVAAFGAYLAPDEIVIRARERAAVLAAENLAEAQRLIKDPTSILQTLTAHASTFSLKDAEKLIASRVIDGDQRAALLEVVVQTAMILENETGLRMTTATVYDEQKALVEAAGILAHRQMPLSVQIDEQVFTQLDAQQQAALKHACAGGQSLVVTTGVPGAGKTVLIGALATALQRAGYRVEGASVTNAAVDVMRSEVDIPTETVASILLRFAREDADGSHGPGGYRPRAWILDEVSTLGTEQGRAFLERAAKNHDVVFVYGDDRQFQAVARGDALGIMSAAAGVFDMTKTRRQREGWMREATEAIRRGDVSTAIGAYHARGYVYEHATQGEARAAILERWSSLERTGVECGIETFTNAERRCINALARNIWRQMGRLKSEDVVLDTMDGKTPFAIGDRLVIRTNVKVDGKKALFNGSVVVLERIDGNVLFVRRKDGEVIAFDLQTHKGAIQHGFTHTEYREQGSTRYAELQMLTKHVNQRSLTVGMTRHTHEYGMFYSTEEFRDGYDAVISLGERSRSKDNATDYTVVKRVSPTDQDLRPEYELTYPALKMRNTY